MDEVVRIKTKEAHEAFERDLTDVLQKTARERIKRFEILREHAKQQQELYLKKRQVAQAKGKMVEDMDEITEEMLDEFFNKPVVIDVSEDDLKPLMADRCSVIREIQDGTGVKLNLNRFEHKLYINGLAEDKQKALAMYNAFSSSNSAVLASLTIKSFDVKCTL